MQLTAWPEDYVLQAIAAENLFADTAFLVPDASGVAASAVDGWRGEARPISYRRSLAADRADGAPTCRRYRGRSA